MSRKSICVIVILILLIIAGAGLRAYRLTYWSLWNDEGHTFDCVRIPLYSPESKEPMAKNYPLNFLVTQVSCHYFGMTELGGRFFPFLMGVLAVPIVFLFTRKIFDDRVALIASGLIAFSPWHVEWSQNARHYTPLFIFMICSAGWFYIGLEKDSPKYLILSMIFVGISVLTHPSGGFLVPGYFLYTLSIPLFGKFGRPKGFNTRNLTIFWTPFVLGFLAISPKFLKLAVYLRTGKVPWNPVTNVMGGVAFYLGVPLLLFSLVGIISLFQAKDRRGNYIFCLLAAQAISLIGVSIFTVASNVYNFFALWLLLMVVVRLGLELADSLPRPRRLVGYAIPALIFLLSLQDLAFYYLYQHGNRMPLRIAVDYVRKHKDYRTGDVLYMSAGSVGDFYLKYHGAYVPLPDVRESAVERFSIVERKVALPITTPGSKYRFEYAKAADCPYAIRWLDKEGFKEADFLAEKRSAWFIYSPDKYAPYPEIDRFLAENCRFLTEFTVNTNVKIRTLRVYRYIAS